MGLKEKIKESRNKLADIELDLEEHAVAPKIPARVYTPTPDEYNKHCATHLPYRNWCPICVQSKKKNPAHRRIDDEQRQRQIPMISMDYMYLNEKSDMKNYPILVIHDSVSEGVWAIPVQRKGDDSYAKKRVCEVIRRLGYSKIVIMSDQEFALADLEEQVRHKEFKEFEKWQDDIKEECGCQVIIQNSPVGESAANGKVENAIQRIQDQIRAIKLDLETNANIKIAPSHPVWPWMIEFAAQTLLYWRISGDDGLTAIQRIRGKSIMSPKPRFGEKVLYKIAKTKKIGKTEARWQYGVWLGSIESSDEHLIGTTLGVIKSRAVTTLQEGDRFDYKMLETMSGTPWKPSSRHPGAKIRTYIDENGDDPDCEDDQGEPDDQPEVQLEEDPDYEEQVKKVKESQELINSRLGESRSFYIKARDVSKYGPTKSCPGCRFVLGEISTQSGHTKMCKKRIMKLMEDDSDDINRVTQWYVNKGIDKEKITVQHEGPDDKEDKMECEPRAEQPSGPVTNSSSSSSDNVDSQMQGAQAPDKRSIIKDENDRLKKKQKTDDDVINEPQSKRKKLGCLNMMQLEDVDTREIQGEVH